MRAWDGLWFNVEHIESQTDRLMFAMANGPTQSALPSFPDFKKMFEKAIPIVGKLTLTDHERMRLLMRTYLVIRRAHSRTMKQATLTRIIKHKRKEIKKLRKARLAITGMPSSAFRKLTENVENLLGVRASEGKASDHGYKYDHNSIIEDPSIFSEIDDAKAAVQAALIPAEEYCDTWEMIFLADILRNERDPDDARRYQQLRAKLYGPSSEKNTTRRPVLANTGQPLRKQLDAVLTDHLKTKGRSARMKSRLMAAVEIMLSKTELYANEKELELELREEIRKRGEAIRRRFPK